MGINNKLSIAPFTNAQLDELAMTKDLYASFVYDELITDVLPRKKIMISDLFDMFIEHVGMSDIKLKYTDDEYFNDDNCVYINNLNESYDAIVFKMIKDIIKIHLINLDGIYKYIDSEMFKIVKLAILNNDDKMIDSLSEGVIYELFKKSNYNFNVKPFKISKAEFMELLLANGERNKNLLKICLEYDINSELSNYQIRNVFSCFSSDVFSKTNNSQKAYLMNLVYNYFSNASYDKQKEYKKVMTNKSSNVEALTYVINDLCLKDDNNYLNEIRNKKLFEDFKTGFHYIILNETKIENIDALGKVSIKKISKK